MGGLRIRVSAVLVVVLCTGCPLHKTPPQQAQAPPLQTGGGTLSPPKTTQPQEKTTSPLASPLPPPSAQTVPLPPPAPKKVRHRVKSTKPVEAKPVEVQAPAAVVPTTATAQAAPAPAGAESASPIGQLTTGDSALGERTKHETTELIGSTQHGLNEIKRSLSTEEKVTVAQIRTFLKEAEQALASGDNDGGHTLATKAKLLLDELVKP